jgi:hypothetical protein
MLIDPTKRVKGDFKKSTQQLMESLKAKIPLNQWTLGDTKVFFKDVAFHELMEVCVCVCVCVVFVVIFNLPFVLDSQSCLHSLCH